MKKHLIKVLCLLLTMSMTACGNALLLQYENTENPASLFTDVGTEETVLSDSDNVIITLNNRPAEYTKRDGLEGYEGFWFDLTIENNSDITMAYVFKFVSVNGIEMPVDEQEALGMMYPDAIFENEKGYENIIIKYEELAQNNIRTIENVSFLVEGYTLNADGTTKDCVYSSGKLEFNTVH